jgi:ferredoxin
MKAILDAVCTGKATPEDLVVLEDLAHTIRSASLCGLGQTAPNPVLTTLRYFRSEYEAHVGDRKCPALICPELLTYSIDTGKCKGCELCRKGCPSKAIAGEKKKPHVIDPAACIRCGACRSVCKFGAIVVA